jgi:hypothetical protein
VAGLEEVPRQAPASAAELDDKTASHRLEQREDPWSAGVGVEPEAEVVHKREIVTVVRQATSAAGSPQVCQRSTSKRTLTPL